MVVMLLLSGFRLFPELILVFGKSASGVCGVHTWEAEPVSDVHQSAELGMDVFQCCTVCEVEYVARPAALDKLLIASGPMSPTLMIGPYALQSRNSALILASSKSRAYRIRRAMFITRIGFRQQWGASPINMGCRTTKPLRRRRLRLQS